MAWLVKAGFKRRRFFELGLVGQRRGFVRGLCGQSSSREYGGQTRMPLSTHLVELSEKHKHLERRIAQEQSRPGSSDQEIRRMKLEKLRLKEEIAKLEQRRH